VFAPDLLNDEDNSFREPIVPFDDALNIPVSFHVPLPCPIEKKVSKCAMLETA